MNRASRKPFHWGGLSGYRQLEAIAQGLHHLTQEPETAYLCQLVPQINRALEKNRALVQDVEEAHSWLMRLADCLRYPPASPSSSESPGRSLSSQQVRREMETLLSQFQPDLKRKPAQAALHGPWHRLWKTWGSDLLYCYDIPNLPPDILQLESYFGKLRNHQRRISGRKSTRPLRYLGQYQSLFMANSEQDLLKQIREVPREVYETQRCRLRKLEAPRQQRYRLHRNPVEAVRGLIRRHTTRRAALSGEKEQSPSAHNG